MDAWLEMLQTLRLSGALFLEAEFSQPWCIRAQVAPEDCSQFAPVPGHLIAYHYVVAGEMLLQVAAMPPVRVESGAIVVLPRNDPHVLGSTLARRPVSADALIQPSPDGGLARIVHGGGGARTQVLCGFLGCDTPHNPLFCMLPAVMVLGVADGASAGWVESSFRFAAAELAANRMKSSPVLARLAELLFMEAVRRFADRLPPAPAGWLAGMQDPRIARALALLHGDPKRCWTTDDLAAELGLSRSAFAERFRRTLGEPPMRYRARQRLELAAQRLAASQDPIARIAYDVGYESESAFTRAFGRVYGTSPAAWRRQPAETRRSGALR